MYSIFNCSSIEIGIGEMAESVMNSDSSVSDENSIVPI